MLKDYIDEHVVQLNAQVSGWEHAVRTAGQLLLDTNQVEQAYVDGMVDAIKELGPYVVIAPGIAFAHARPDSSVKKDCISVLTLDTPVEFGSAENDPVDTVFAFGATSKDCHMSVLTNLCEFLSDDDNLTFLRETDNKAQLVEKMCEY
ncbi:PTS sugar transporter subunit IIA [Thaumasiovibrio subtropicus]|uniref:PTS sugar transporter subunit IIA n=1 Tax=Thaumasiovibrio subtropicus TaxID=1891207 RepID=UPI000B3525AC|nr:PTS sugar transporter subunit IIA [Thaumasiovibrio subtropicus]